MRTNLSGLAPSGNPGISTMRPLNVGVGVPDCVGVAVIVEVEVGGGVSVRVEVKVLVDESKVGVAEGVFV